MLLFRCHFGKSTSTATKKHAADRRRKGKNADGEKEEERKCRQCELVNSTSTLREYGKGCCSVLVVFWCRNHTKMCWWEESLQRLHQICMQCQLKSVCECVYEECQLCVTEFETIETIHTVGNCGCTRYCWIDRRRRRKKYFFSCRCVYLKVHCASAIAVSLIWLAQRNIIIIELHLIE